MTAHSQGQRLSWPSILSKVAALLHASSCTERDGTGSRKQKFKKINTSVFQYFQNLTRFVKGNTKCLSIFRSLRQGCIYFVHLPPLFFPPLLSIQARCLSFSFIYLKALDWYPALHHTLKFWQKKLEGFAGRETVHFCKNPLLNLKFQKCSKTCYIRVQISGPHQQLEDHWVWACSLELPARWEDHS